MLQKLQFLFVVGIHSCFFEIISFLFKNIFLQALSIWYFEISLYSSGEPIQ